MDCFTATSKLLTKTEKSLQATTSITKKMAKVESNTKMELSSKEILKMTKQMDLEKLSAEILLMKETLLMQ